jgi:hypothetical protein
MSSWDFEPLWNKTKLFVARASDEEQDGPLFPFWSILALELLGRAALASVSPVLLADGREGENIFYALGFERTNRPRSVPAATVFRRCAVAIDQFTEGDLKGTLALIELRNEELHSGGTPFEKLPTGLWLPDYYRLSQLLLSSFGRELDDLFSEEESSAAQQMIDGAAEKVESEVKQLIADTQRGYERQPDPTERARHRGVAETHVKQLFEQSRLSAAAVGKVVPCPSCGAQAWLTGELIRSGEPRVGPEAILTEVIKLPTKFRCFVCGLDLEGHGRLHAAGFGGSYSEDLDEDPASFYDIQFEISEADLAEHFAEEYGNE